MSSNYKLYDYRGVSITASAYLTGNLNAFSQAPKFQKWIDLIIEQGDIELKEFVLTDINWFGPAIPAKLGFFKGTCEAVDAITKQRIASNIVFGRGECVTCLVVCQVKGTTDSMVVLCKQQRIGSGGKRIESCAGMVDDSTGDFVGPMVKEIEEELGIKIKHNDSRLVKLGGKFWTSPGASDEAIQPFLLEIEITAKKYEEMKNTVYGVDENELITLQFVDVRDMPKLLDTIGDVKTEIMWRRYRDLDRSHMVNMPASSSITCLPKICSK
jgi:8-oxo-dGTP pyrophosphatase MutT (NUDIX family)